MRKLFKSSQPSVLGDKVNFILHRIQLRFAQWMQKREAKWTVAQKRLYLGIFLFVSCAACVSIFISGLNHQPHSSNEIIRIAPIRRPVIQQSFSPSINLNADDTLKALAFLRLVDSLELSENGRKQLQKYFETRPGMRDSIPILKQIFNK